MRGLNAPEPTIAIGGTLMVEQNKRSAHALYLKIQKTLDGNYNDTCLAALIISLAAFVLANTTSSVERHRMTNEIITELREKDRHACPH
jgi:hypothetical protein